MTTKNKIIIGITILVIAVITTFFIWRGNLLRELSYWRNEAAKREGIIQVKQQLFETQAQEVSKLDITNTDLKKRLDDTDRNLHYYQDLSLKYERGIGKINTQVADSNNADTTYYKPTSKDRIFNTTVDSEVSIAGYFQPYAPYNLYVNDITFLFNLKIAISQDGSGAWFWDLHTSSKYLKPTQVNVQILPRPSPWELFAMSNLYFTDLKVSGLSGADLKAGLKKGSWGVAAGIYVDFDTRVKLSVGIIKFLEL